MTLVGPRGEGRTTGWFSAVFALLAGCAAASPASAQSDLQQVPALTAHVNDLTGTLDPTQRATLEDELRALEQTKGSQVGILMVATTQPEDIAAYGIRVADAWKLGRQGTDDGVILIVAKDDRRVRIEVGRGLEGAIPDAAAARVIREFIAPRFRADDYYGGLHDAVDAIGKLIRDEPLPAPLTDEPGDQTDLVARLGPALVAGWFVALFLRGVLRRAPTPLRGVVTGMGSGGVAWLVSGLIPLGVLVGIVGMVIGLLGAGVGRFVNRGGWGGFSGGGFGGGGFGGGGFGGGHGGGFSGGGGGFSGGGASGKW